jgi:hypothetical protein
VSLATQEAEIKRIVVQRQPGQTVQEPLCRKTLYKQRAGGVAQGKGPEFKPQYHKKKKKKPINMENVQLLTIRSAAQNEEQSDYLHTAVKQHKLIKLI